MLVDLVTTSDTDDNIIMNWNNSIDVIMHTSPITTTTVTGNIGSKFNGDLYGLFLEMGIPSEFIYPHILANGYVNSQDYDGKKLTLTILDQNTLKNYLNYFKNI